MKSEHLRIGNWVQFRHTETPVRITLGDFVREYNDEHLEDYEPIPLTEEWLIKFGFDTDRVCWFLEGVELGDFADGFWFLPNGSLTTRSIKIKYVHSLQNLYFCLTQKELQYEAHR